jgi:hypothetical protein
MQANPDISSFGSWEENLWKTSNYKYTKFWTNVWRQC